MIPLPAPGDVRDGRLVLSVQTVADIKRYAPELTIRWNAMGVVAVAMVSRPKGSLRGIVYFDRDGRMRETRWLTGEDGRS